MDNDPIDLLQIKIDKAKEDLSPDTLRSIDAVDWKKAIIDMRAQKGYSFEQLEDLETETELLLAGLLDPEDYPKEIEKRLGLSKAQTSDLVQEMNAKVFSRIREEFIKITENKKLAEERIGVPTPAEIKKPIKNTAEEKNAEPPEKTLASLESEKELSAPAEKFIPVGWKEKTAETQFQPVQSAQPAQTVQPAEPSQPIPPAQATGAPKPIFVQKLSTPFKTTIKTTEYTLPNVKGEVIKPKVGVTKPAIDPYREIPE